MERTAHTPPGLPVVGSLPRLARDPLRFLTGIQDAYGNQYPLVRVGPPVGQSVTVVLDPELAHDILADRDRFRRPDGGLQEQRRQGLVSSDGALWEQQRSVLDPEFVGGRLAEYAEIAGETLDETLTKWPESGTVDLFEELSILTMRVITRSLFSRDTDRERGETVHEALATFSDEFDASVFDLLLPERLQSGVSGEFEEADAALDSVATEFVDWHLDHEDPPRDVITALIEAKADPDIELSENELIDQTVLFMTGGQETTALTIAYAFYWLSQNPEAKERVRAEAKDVLDGGRPGWADLSELTYTERVVRETLRLTPAAWNVSREPREPVTLAGTQLDAGEFVMLPIYAHHRDRRVWSDPLTFDPERWAGDASRGDSAYYPFGSGPRVCIGRQIALTEAQFALTHILQHYDVQVTTSELDLQPSVTLRPSGRLEAEITAID
jgi:cytochrome P450